MRCNECNAMHAGSTVGPQAGGAAGADADAAGDGDAAHPVQAGGEQEEDRARTVHMSVLLLPQSCWTHGSKQLRGAHRAARRRASARALGQARRRSTLLARHLAHLALLAS